MTALNFIIDDNSVFISMDTLAISIIDKKPLQYLCKLYPLSHMNCVICGVGKRDAIFDWYVYVSKRLTSIGINRLTEFSKKNMLEYFEMNYKGDYCEIYQFGLDEKINKFKGYVYRSHKGYVCEELEKGMGIRPNIFSEKGISEYFDISKNEEFKDNPFGLIEKGLSDIMKKQKEEDETASFNDKLGIGGIIQTCYMTKDYLVIKNYEKFGDFNENYDAILNKYS